MNYVSQSAALVSVIMPVYNGERFIAEAIDSVLAQTYPDWELIVVDDGSTDMTPEILGRYDDRRIRALRQENQGEAGARNTGLDNARGEYVALLDADDAFLPTAVDDYVRHFSEHDHVDVIFADCLMCDPLGNPVSRLSEHRAAIVTGQILEPLVLAPMVVSYPLAMSVRRGCVKEHSLRFDVGLRYGVDWDFWIQAAQFCYFDYLPKVTGRYRVHGSGMTLGASEKQRKEYLVAGRLKIMQAPWFDELSLPTRARFFHNLLTILLDDETADQTSILQSLPFAKLPKRERARQLQLIASSYLRRQREVAFARRCLVQALELEPKHARSKILLRLSATSPAFAGLILSAWHSAGRIRRKWQRLDRKPFPLAVESR